MATKINCFLIILAFIGVTSCKTSQLTLTTPETGMFKVAILYPNGAGKTFDLDYYEKTHMPLVAGLLGKNLKLP